MKHTTWRARARRTFAVVLTAALGGGLLTATGAAADEAALDVTGGSAQWGVKASFRSYLDMPFSGGATEVVPPAVRLPDGTFELGQASGRVEGTTADLAFGGSLHFTAHDGALDLTFSEPRVRIDGERGALVVDAAAREFAGTEGDLGELVTYDDVELGEIDLSAAPLTVADGTASVTGAPVVLTEAGAAAFGGFYDAGSELDPLSFTVSVAPVRTAPVVTAQPQDVSVAEGEDAVFTAAATGTPEPTAGWQTRPDAAAEWQDVAGADGATLTLPDVTAGQTGSQVRAVFSNGTAPDAVTAPATLTVTEDPSGEPGEMVPALEVFAADGVTPVDEVDLVYGDTVVVRGSGFDPAANVGGRGVPIPATLPQGTYVVFGKFAEQWQPSQDAPSSARVVGDQRWALAEGVLEQVPERFQQAIRGQWVDIAEDGTFTAELTVQRPVVEGVEQEWPESGTLGVYTYAAGGVKNPEQELAVPLTVAEERTPRLTVTPTEGLTVGTVVTVEGTGYAPDRAISIAFTPNTVKQEEFGWPVGWLQHEVVTTDALGSFTREITVSGWVTGTGDDCSEVQCYLASFNSAQASDAVETDHRAERDMDVFVPVTFVAGPTEPEPGTPGLTVEPNQVPQGGSFTVRGTDLPPGEVTVALESAALPAVGHLDWGVKDSFRSYVTGPVGGGRVTLGEGVGTNADGTYRFPATEAVEDGQAGTALLTFGGSVAFRAHDVGGTPALDIELRNLRVQVTPDAALLLADATSREFAGTTSVGQPVEYPDVVLATLDRDAVTLGAGRVQADAAAAELTASGVPAFGRFYPAGSALDPVTLDVTVGGVARVAQVSLAASAPTVLGTAVVGQDGVLEATFTVPDDLPVGGYVLAVRDSAGTVLAEDTLTVLAADPGPTEPGTPGEEPGEEEPVRGTLTVTPDPLARGASATLTGTGLEPGTRVGAVIDAAGAPGTLEWGVKETFRSYITGPIAHGAVAVTAPAAQAGDGTFTFGSGNGRGDATNATAGFSGTVTFTGHDIAGTPALRVAISDPTVLIEDGAGYLVANVTSRSLDGTQNVDYPRVRLATLDLSGVTVREGRLVGTDVPATLTAAGVPAFADFYEAGAALDPLTFSVPVGDGDLDLSTLDVAEATVGPDGTVELRWEVPQDLALGEHRVDLVTAGSSVADATVTVVDAGTAPAGGGTTASAGDRLATTGAEVSALAALGVVLLLGGAVLARRRQPA